MSYNITSSGLQTADAVILATGGFVHAVTLIPAAADCSVVIYDNASSASGTVVAKVTLFTALAQGSTTITFQKPVCANAGIYADVAGTGANYIVHYSVGA